MEKSTLNSQWAQLWPLVFTGRLLLWSDFRIANKFYHRRNVYVMSCVHTILELLDFLSLIQIAKKLESNQTVYEAWKKVMKKCMYVQGGKTWQPFVGSKNGNENFRQAPIYNFRVKCVVFAHNCKFANIIQYNIQCISCYNTLLALETPLLSQKA